MTIHLFYKDGKIWAVENLPEKPRQWDYEAGGDPPYIPPFINPEYYEILEEYDTAIRNAIEVANPPALREFSIFNVPPDVPSIIWAKTWEDRTQVWPGKMEIINGKAVLTI